MDKLRTRFAPSPTGYLHIGGARTALFNYLLARQSGGTFILRIEDADQSRHDESAVGKIAEDLRWLGIQWDEGVEVGGDYGPYRQSEKFEIYNELIDKLLAEGKAPKEIAVLLGVSTKTISSHRRHMMAKLGVRSLAGLVRYAIQQGIASLER